jgi:hypothetical protein
MCKRKRRESAFSSDMLDRPAPGCNTITDLTVPFEPHPPEGARRRRLWNISPPPFTSTVLLSCMHAYQAKPSPRPTKLIPSRLALRPGRTAAVQARATLSAVQLLVRVAEVPLADVAIPRRPDIGRGA